MHSSYGLASADFSVERNGQPAPLSSFWPGGWQPGDRLGVLFANPMDAIGCSNLICGTNTLFYDRLRDQHGQGNFFRYADTYLFGVGCEPGDFNQLDVWPLHKWVTILQPTAEAVIEAINDRRITLLAIPETGVRCRGEVVLSTWNAFVDQVRTVVLYSSRTGRARNADVSIVGNRVVESYVEQAIFTTPGMGHGEQAKLRRIRRAIEREPLVSVEEFRFLPNVAQARSLLGVSEVLPPGHQELTRRAAPTVIMPIEVPMPPVDAASAPLDPAPGVEAPIEPSAPGSEALLHTAFDAVQRRRGGRFAEWEGWDWISDFGDPVSEHHNVREAVGVWDESPLRKWLISGPDALAAVDFCFVNDMRTLQAGQARYGAFCDAFGKMLGDGVVFYGGDPTRVWAVTALDSDGDHFRQIARGRFDVQIEDLTMAWPHLQVQGPRSRELVQSLTDFDVESLRYFRYTPEGVTIGGVPGCILARTGYSGELGYEIYVPAQHAEAVWTAIHDAGAALGVRPYGLAAVESLRIESGLIFLGYDYFQGHTSPFHMNLDRTIRLDTDADFNGKAALQAELDAGITHRLVTVVVGGEESPDYGSPLLHHGRRVGTLLSPSAGRSPTVDRLIGIACIEAELTEVGTQLHATLPDGRLAPAVVEVYPIYDPEKKRPRG